MTNFERIARTPETLAAFLAGLTAVNTPWEQEHTRRECINCEKDCCDGCSSIRQAEDPLWWLLLEEPEEQKQKIRVLRKQPEKAPEIIEIENTLDAIQGAVGGYIETFTLAEDACIICDEEGKIKDRPYNCRICGEYFVGDILVVGTAGEDFASLKEPERVAAMLWPAWYQKYDQE